MHVDAATHESRKDHVVLCEPECAEKRDNPQSLVEGMKADHQRCADGNGERTDQRDELEQAGCHTKQKCVRHAYQHESERAEHANEETGQQRCTHVPCERVIDVLEHVSAAAAKPPARQGQQHVPAERRTVLQEEKRHHRNQNEPRQIAQQRQQAAKAVTQRISRRLDRASKCPIMASRTPGGNRSELMKCCHACS
jgi:hypothetical protein